MCRSSVRSVLFGVRGGYVSRARRGVDGVVSSLDGDDEEASVLLDGGAACRSVRSMRVARIKCSDAVSYTHLTLPTILLV